MFERRARFQSDDEYRRQRASKQGATLAQWRREAETWFDGSLESVDRRLAMCQRLLGFEQERVARNGITASNGRALAFIGSLEQSRAALVELRHDLLTGSTWRETPPARRDPRREAALLASLPSQDRRYVELTSASIVANDREHMPGDELAIQARYRAARDNQSDQVIDALALRVGQRAALRPRVKMALAPTSIPDVPAELLYL